MGEEQSAATMNHSFLHPFSAWMAGWVAKRLPKNEANGRKDALWHCCGVGQESLPEQWQNFLLPPPIVGNNSILQWLATNECRVYSLVLWNNFGLEVGVLQCLPFCYKLYALSIPIQYKYVTASICVTVIIRLSSSRHPPPTIPSTYAQQQSYIQENLSFHCSLNISYRHPQGNSLSI